ncbi:heterokaryon incompatibility protein-domain-containing protein [Nemania sp. FL0916]|nr:heterokaryon incompatibility protein-domain-containing protein [Nemania sp. FL0916]
MPFQYEPVIGRQFRLIHLPPGNGDVYVEISVDDIPNHPEGPNDKPYEALSWQWGKDDPFGVHVIYIRNVRSQEEFTPMRVRPNLFWALKSIRQCYRGFEPFWLWVDFICINQGNVDERQQQVGWMTEIYGNARRVHIWLGKPGYPVDDSVRENITDEEVKNAVQHIKRLGKLDDANHLGSVDLGIRYKATLHNLEPLFKLLKSGWFKRRWIIQEVGVAKQATVHCGDEQFSWEELTHAVALLERIGRDGSIDRLFKLRPDTRHVSQHAGNISALPAYRLIQNVSGLYRVLSNRERSEARTLEQLICFLVVFECSEPRDVIYAVLGIASDFRPVAPTIQPALDQAPPALNDQAGNQEGGDGREEFEVNYTEGILDVYKRFFERAVQKSRSLDLLCRPWAPANRDELPSWILDATRKPFRATVRGKMIRHNPDPFVGPAINRGSFYTASGSRGQTDTNEFFRFAGATNSRAIIVQGFKLGSPSEIWDLAVHGSIPASWLKVAKWSETTKPPPDELWRTVVADRTNAGVEPEPEYPSVIQYAVLEKGIEYGINTNEFLHETDNTAYYEVFRRIQAVVWNRKLIRAALDRAYGMEPCLGLVPADTQQSDSIYIVRGCSVPLVLREKPPQTTNANERGAVGTATGTGLAQTGQNQGTIHQLIGECYINNMMDGLAIRGRREGPPTWDSITIE